MQKWSCFKQWRITSGQSLLSAELTPTDSLKIPNNFPNTDFKYINSALFFRNSDLNLDSRQMPASADSNELRYFYFLYEYILFKCYLFSECRQLRLSTASFFIISVNCALPWLILEERLCNGFLSLPRSGIQMSISENGCQSKMESPVFPAIWPMTRNGN